MKFSAPIHAEFFTIASRTSGAVFDVNNGSVGTDVAWVDEITIRNVTTGQVLHTDTVAGNSLAAGGSLAQQYEFTLPSGAAGAGQIEITVVTNAVGGLTERNDAGTAGTNNSAVHTVTSTVAAERQRHGGRAARELRRLALSRCALRLLPVHRGHRTGQAHDEFQLQRHTGPHWNRNSAKAPVTLAI